MTRHYAVLAARVRQELVDLERVVSRAERAMAAAGQRAEDQDLFLDSVALNLHDFYTGLERILHQVAQTIDETVPLGRNWHRELLENMTVEVLDVRPPVLTRQTADGVVEYLRFRHVVRNIYTFQLDPERLGNLVWGLRQAFGLARNDLDSFCGFLDGLASDE